MPASSASHQWQGPLDQGRTQAQGRVQGQTKSADTYSAAETGSSAQHDRRAKKQRNDGSSGVQESQRQISPSSLLLQTGSNQNQSNQAMSGGDTGETFHHQPRHE